MKYNLLAYKVFIYNYLSYSDDDVDIYFEDVSIYSFGLKENLLSRGQNKRGGGGVPRRFSLTTHQALQYGKLNNPED